MLLAIVYNPEYKMVSFHQTKTEIWIANHLP